MSGMPCNEVIAASSFSFAPHGCAAAVSPHTGPLAQGSGASYDRDRVTDRQTSRQGSCLPCTAGRQAGTRQSYAISVS